MTLTQRNRFAPFNIGKHQYYLDKQTSKVVDETEFQSIITANHDNDKQRGYQDRIAGYYDKWYRYNRLDEGEAYDEGQLLAVNSGIELPEMQIIPCIV